MDIYRWWSWLLLWKQNPRVHSSMVRAADCRSAGPWFNSGWRSWFIFMTRSDNLMNHPAQRYNIMSPIRTVITTITRKSVKMVAEPSNNTVRSRIPRRLEDNSTVAKAATATAVALDTKTRAAQGTVVQLKSELTQYQQSRTKHAIALKSPSEFGADTVVGRIPRRLAGESLDRLGNPTFRLGLQSQEQNVRPDKDQLTTDIADLKMTKDALAEDTTAFEDITQDCLVCQTKAADFEVYTNKSLSEELEALVKAKAVISEKTDDAEHRDNRSVLSSRGSLVSFLPKKRELDRICANRISC